MIRIVTGNEEISLYYIWATSSFLHMLPLVDLLKRDSSFGKLFDVLSYSIKIVGPFFMVVAFVYILFAQIGISLFGGCINQKTYALYLDRTGGDLNR